MFIIIRLSKLRFCRPSNLYVVPTKFSLDSYMGWTFIILHWSNIRCSKSIFKYKQYKQKSIGFITQGKMLSKFKECN